MTVKGKADPLAPYRPLRPRRPLRLRCDPHPHDASRRPRAREDAPDRHVRALRPATLRATGDDRGRARRREEPTLRRALRPHRGPSPGLVRWRQGRSLPYGEGIAFWALGEIVKAECGILESDSPDEAEAKLVAALPSDDPDLAWLEARLAPLVGWAAIPSRRRSRSRRGVVSSSISLPGRETVLVFEDLHWADAALLSFLEHLAVWAEGSRSSSSARRGRSCTRSIRTSVPTAKRTADQPRAAHRPRDGAPAHLAPRPAALPAETQRRCSSGRVATLSTRRSSLDCWPTGICFGTLEDIPFPDSVQALIAARLDTLSSDASYSCRTPRSSAASSGRARSWRWAGASAGGRAGFHELSRKELVRPSRGAPMEGDHESASGTAGPRRLLRADPTRRPRRPPSGRRGLDPGEGWRSGGGSRRRARTPLPDALELTGPAGRSDESRESMRRRSTTSCSQVNGLCRSMSRAQKVISPSARPLSAGHPGGPPSSSAGRRRRCSRPACKRRDRHSRRRSN